MKPRSRKPVNGFSKVQPQANGDAIMWEDATGAVRSAPADGAATSLNLHLAQMSRQPVKYQHRGHYEGRYWFSGTGTLVWHESMVEYSALMWWDHRQSITAIASQPMCLRFADGSRHYPDFFAVHSDGSQVLYDVRPLALMDENTTKQFDKTRELCRQTGWRYEVFHGLDDVTRFNLEWIAAYRHGRCEPEVDLRNRVLEFLSVTRSIDDVRSVLDPVVPVRFIPQLYNMMWHRQVLFDFTRPMAGSTLIWKA